MSQQHKHESMEEDPYELEPPALPISSKSAAVQRWCQTSQPTSLPAIAGDGGRDLLSHLLVS